MLAHWLWLNSITFLALRAAEKAKRMIEFEEAVSRILALMPPSKSEQVLISTGCGRVAAADVRAEIDLPPFDNSTFDGYAVRAEDTSGASLANPISLRVIGRATAGEPFHGKLSKGNCVRLFTGSVMPSDADAVVMQEDTQAKASSESVDILDAVKPWEGVRFRGEDVKRGAVMVHAGQRLTAAQIGLLAAAGIHLVAVGTRPRVALLATGNELREAGTALQPGEIYESNRASLIPLIQAAGGEPISYPIVPDDLQKTTQALEQAFAECDIVVTCGGVSVGELDLVKPAFESLGGKLEFWKVAIKPGRPFVVGRLKDKFLFGLPGNPVSAFVTFILLARPALLKWQGASQLFLPYAGGTLTEPLANDGKRRHFMRVKVDSVGKVSSAGTQASHILRSLADANGLVDVPPESIIPRGATVKVLRWE